MGMAEEEPRSYLHNFHFYWGMGDIIPRIREDMAIIIIIPLVLNRSKRSTTYDSI